MSDQLVITVSGPQGSGKTTLAHQIIRSLWSRPGPFKPHFRDTTLISRFNAVDETAGGLEIGTLGADNVSVVLRTQLPGDREPVESLDDVVGLGPWPDSASRGAPVDPPFGCAALPPVGPLTSTEGLQPGDVVRVIAKLDGGPAEGSVVRVGATHADLIIPAKHNFPGWDVHAFAFVGRPDAEGWIPWSGGECPLPEDTKIDARMRDGETFKTAIKAHQPIWTHGLGYGDITAFRIVGLTDTPRQGDPVEPPFGAKTIEVKGYDLSRTPKDIVERAFAIIHDAGPDCRIKELAIMPNTGRLRVEAWPDGSDGPLNTYEETVAQMLAYYRSTWATDGRWTPNPADAKVTISPHSVQDGDRVRVVIEGVVGQVHEFALNTITRTKLEKMAVSFGATIELLERPEKPLAVGDKIKAKEIRAAVDALNALVYTAQTRGLTVEFDTLPLSRMTGPETSLLTVTVHKEI